MLALVARISADHYQFYLYDEGFQHYEEPLLDWQSSQRLEFGYLAVPRAIYVSTVAHLNSHRLRVYVGERPHEEYERVFTWNLLIESGVLLIAAPTDLPEDILKVQVKPGGYECFVCSSAVGVDELDTEPDRDEPLSDEEFLKRDDFEHYDVYLSPLA